MGTYAIGVDLGGTTVKCGIVAESGAVLRQISLDAKADRGPEAVVAQILAAISEIQKHPPAGSACAGIGIGAPGVVSLDADTVSYPPNFAGWGDFRLASAVARAYPLTVRVENDANAAALAEARYGAGRKHKDFLFVIWGTGVGGGIIIDRKVFHGSRGGAGEIGHVSIDHAGPPCKCGNRGCVESYVGGRQISERTRDLLAALPKGARTPLILELAGGDPARIEPALVAKAALEGDELARRILSEAGTLLGVALASALNILDLDVAVIGGGISGSPQFVFDAVTESIRSRVLESHRPLVKVLRAELGNTAGIIGAASLVL